MSELVFPLRPDLFLKKIRIRGNCWLWTGAIARNAYGRYGNNYAHRVSYRMFVGPIPADLVLDHLCRVRHCVRPEHLEAVTQRENLMRGDTIIRAKVEQTHCSSGHAFDVANTYRNAQGHRSCRTCHRERERVRGRRAA